MQLSNKTITFLSRLTGVCSSLSALILMGMLLLASAPAAAQNAGTSPTSAAGMVCKPGFATRANACGGRTPQYCRGAPETPRGNTCVACDPGHASPDGKDCRPCDQTMLGNTGGNKGATMCVYPGPGKATMPPSSRVNTYTVNCAVGLFNPGNRVSIDYRGCERCPVNTYSNVPGSAKCVPCPPGKSTKGTQGNSSCS